jgi:hypothetical protein
LCKFDTYGIDLESQMSEIADQSLRHKHSVMIQCDKLVGGFNLVDLDDDTIDSLRDVLSALRIAKSRLARLVNEQEVASNAIPGDFVS